MQMQHVRCELERTEYGFSAWWFNYSPQRTWQHQTA